MGQWDSAATAEFSPVARLPPPVFETADIDVAAPPTVRPARTNVMSRLLPVVMAIATVAMMAVFLSFPVGDGTYSGVHDVSADDVVVGDRHGVFRSGSVAQRSQCRPRGLSGLSGRPTRRRRQDRCGTALVAHLVPSGSGSVVDVGGRVPDVGAAGDGLGLLRGPDRRRNPAPCHPLGVSGGQAGTAVGPGDRDGVAPLSFNAFDSRGACLSRSRYASRQPWLSAGIPRMPVRCCGR